MADPQPTTWRTTPACATEEMIEAGVAEVKSRFPMMDELRARYLVQAIHKAALKASPRPPPLPEPPATGDADHA